MRIFGILPVVLVMTACATPREVAVTTQATPQPAAVKALDPVGSYEIVTVVDGQNVTGTISITGTPGAYKGKILTNMFPEIPIHAAVVEGQGMIVRANMPDGELILNMRFTGPAFVGRWDLGGIQGGDISGKKLP